MRLGWRTDVGSYDIIDATLLRKAAEDGVRETPVVLSHTANRKSVEQGVGVDSSCRRILKK